MISIKRDDSNKHLAHTGSQNKYRMIYLDVPLLDGIAHSPLHAIGSASGGIGDCRNNDLISLNTPLPLKLLMQIHMQTNSQMVWNTDPIETLTGRQTSKHA